MKGVFITAGLVLVSVTALSTGAGAYDCPSMVKSALKPITADSPLTWAVEGTVRAGRTDNGDFTKNFNNEILFGGLGYRFSPLFRAYLEGGVKYWNKTGPDGGSGGGGRGQGEGDGGGQCPAVEGDWSEKSHAGFREFYLEYLPDLNAVRGGAPGNAGGRSFPG